MDWERETLGILILGGTFVALLAVAECWARLRRPAPELPRKLVHVGGGLACLGFPFLIQSPWTVLAMALALSTLFWLGARWKFLKGLHSIERNSRGSEYFPLAIFNTFILTSDKPWIFFSAVLTLANADAFAGLIGSRYGRVRYQIEDETKSLEGSLAFLFCAALSIALPLLLMSSHSWPVVGLSAILLAIFITGIEAISLNGSDNLFIPIAVCVGLDKLLKLPLYEISDTSLRVALLCVAIGLLASHCKVLNTGARIVCVLFAVASFAMGSWHWAIPVLVGLAFHCAMESFKPIADEQTCKIRVRLMSRILLPSTVILIFANSLSWHSFLFGPYLAGSATVLALSLCNSTPRLQTLWWTRAVRAIATALIACLCAQLPLLIFHCAQFDAAMTAGVSCLIACLLDALFSGSVVAVNADQAWNVRRFLLPFTAALCALEFQLMQFSGDWPLVTR